MISMVTRFLRRDMRHPDFGSVFNLEWAKFSQKWFQNPI
ncbi:hypothetical protein D3OALGA1CA_3227 [Olavius algarvensis associated proteobacterium Delta 3]|nr:hypothetical protein D3OALGA1CA_3227 [Olavius algarvensis associated proteobacterium Delta 3]CAB5144795.1 hypothetical protein D3OALGB2SA_4441 [Olavius algarvensis associated proteobacterium Delta 3]